MKRLLIILLSLILLVSCAIDENSDYPGDGEKLTFNNVDLTGKTITIYDKTAVVRTLYNGEEGVVGGFFNYEKLSEILGCDIEVKTYSDNVQYTKILAGDSDIDIYVLTPYEAKKLSGAGALYPIMSQQVKSYNSKCFDSLDDFATNDEGETELMPVSANLLGLFAPKSAVEELGITADDVRNLYDFLDVIKNYDGERKVYSSNSIQLFNNINDQYGLTYCDYDNGEFNYDTEVYRKYFSTLLDGWSDYNMENPWYSVHDANISVYNSTRSLFVLDSFGTRMDLQNYYSDWVAFPTPRLDENVENIPIFGMFLCINPSSLQLDESQKVLEIISQNYYDVTGYNAKSNLIFKDISMYEVLSDVETNSEIFKTYLEIMEDTVIFDDSMLADFLDDINGYQDGTLTLDEAIELKTKAVDVRLNE